MGSVPGWCTLHHVHTPGTPPRYTHPHLPPSSRAHAEATRRAHRALAANTDVVDVEVDDDDDEVVNDDDDNDKVVDDNEVKNVRKIG